MHQYISPTRNILLHKAWRFSVRTADNKGTRLSADDVHLIKKFMNLKKLRLSNADGAPPVDALPMSKLVSEIAPSLSNLTHIFLTGPSSFDVLKALHDLPRLRERLIVLHLTDKTYDITSADMNYLSELKANKQIKLTCNSIPNDSIDQMIAVSDALNGSLLSMSLIMTRQSTPEILAAFPGRITSIYQLWLNNGTDSYDDTQQQAHEAGIIAAIAPLKGLKLLELHTAVMSAGAQQQALAGLTRLTGIILTSKQQGTLALIPSQDTLEVLNVDDFAIEGELADAVLQLPELFQLKARLWQPSKQWMDKVAEGSKIERLFLWGSGIPDASLMNIPTLPLLTYLFVFCRPAGIVPTSESYQNLACLLQHHAATLQHLVINTSREFRELPMLLQLSMCETLMLGRPVVGVVTLRCLSRWQLPALQDVTLHALPVLLAVTEAEVGWLGRLPVLKEVSLPGFSAAVKQQVAALFQGRPEVKVT